MYTQHINILLNFFLEIFLITMYLYKLANIFLLFSFYVFSFGYVIACVVAY